jgi:hypothetical protein
MNAMKNIQHSTFNDQHPKVAVCSRAEASAFDVECWLLNVDFKKGVHT